MRKVEKFEPARPAAAESRRSFLKTAAASIGAATLLGPAGARASRQARAKPPSGMDYDVIVVGGGFAGVTAARDCRKNGLRTLLLEARNRLGGRTFDTHFGAHHVELGGTWVHWSQPHVWSEIQRYGLAIEDTPGAVPDRIIATVGGKTLEFATEERLREIVAGSDAYFEESRLVWDRPYDTHFRWAEIGKRDSMSAADRLQALKLTALQRDTLVPLIEAMAHCPLHQASYVEMLRWYALPLHNFGVLFDSEARYRIKDGTGALIRRMAEDGKPEIRLSAPVTRIAQTADGVIVTTQGGTAVSARALVLAVPPRVVKNIEFTPALSAAKLEASRTGFTSSGIKYYVEVKGRIGNLQLMTPPEGRLGLAWTYASLPESTLLVGFAPAQRDLDGNDEEDMQKALRQLIPDAQVLACTSYGWNEDPFALGTFSSYAPGQLVRCFDALRRREGQIFMAGADVHDAGWRSFIDGAIGSGARVAYEIGELLLS